MEFLALLLVLASSQWLVCAETASECPALWSHLKSNHCECGMDLEGGIICSGQEVHLRVDYTMTVDPRNNEIVAALNDYGYDDPSALVDRVYTILPNGSHYLNETICAPNNRKGLLCQDCIEGFGPTAFISKCANCTKYSLVARLAAFMALKLIPITVMFGLLLIFQINLSHGPAFGYIIYCQAVMITIRLLSPFYELLLHQLNEKRNIVNLLLFLTAFWDMDYSPLFGTSCISSSFKNIDVLLLNYVSVFYPLILVALSYAFLELHGRNFKPVVLMWKPCGMLLLRLRKNLDASGSIIHAYATILLLSFCSFNFNSYMVLKSTIVYSENKQMKAVMLYQPSITVNSHRYMVYLMLILLLMLVFGFIPTILLFVHSVKGLKRKFDKCCSMRTQIAMNTFADTFQGTFRDNYRVLAAILALSVMFSALIGAFGKISHMPLVGFFLIVLMLASAFISFFRPFKRFLTNVSVTFHFFWMTAMTIFISHYVLDIGSVGSVYPALFLCLFTVPHVIMLLWLTVAVLNKLGCVKFLRQLVFGVGEEREGLLPDRLENSFAYRELSASSSHKSYKTLKY